MASWYISTLVWHSGQGVEMTSAPAASAQAPQAVQFAFTWRGRDLTAMV
jgi:hypothetical protein